MLKAKESKFGILCVYRIVNTQTGQFYIGSAKCFRKRIADHHNKLRKNKHPNRYMQNVFTKHGIEIFRVEIVENVSVEQALIETEQKWLDSLFDRQQKCYNICPTAGSSLGRKHSEESKEKIRQAHLGKKFSKEHKRKISEHKKKQKHLHFKSGPGNPMWKIGPKHHMFGKKHTEESKRKMSVAQKKISKEMLGRTVAQYNFDGVLINSFVSCSEAARSSGISGIR